MENREIGRVWQKKKKRKEKIDFKTSGILRAAKPSEKQQLNSSFTEEFGLS